MIKSKRVGCCCILACMLAYLLVGMIWSCCRDRRYEFELKILSRAPDLNQYAVIRSQVQDRHDYHMPYGYFLYHDALRENGVESLILTDQMCSQAGTFFGDALDCPVAYVPCGGGKSFFGELPKLAFPGHSNVVEVIQDTTSCSNALKAIDDNITLQFHWRNSDELQSFDLLEHVGEWSGIGATKWDYFGRGETSVDLAKAEAKEAITACAILAAFPDLRTARIDETVPIVEKRVFWARRVPVFSRVEIVAKRGFDFYDENGSLYASLLIGVDYDSPFGWQLEGYEKIYKAIFSEVFRQLRMSSGRCVVRGKALYDGVKRIGLVCDLKKENMDAR